MTTVIIHRDSDFEAQWGKKKKKGLSLFPFFLSSICQEVIGLNGVGNRNLVQYSGLENPMNRGAWWATVHPSQSEKQLK